MTHVRADATVRKPFVVNASAADTDPGGVMHRALVAAGIAKPGERLAPNEITRRLQAHGYDGVEVRQQGFNHDIGGSQLIAFNGNQVHVRPGSAEPDLGGNLDAPAAAEPHLETHDYEGRVGDPNHITRKQTGTVPTAAIADLLGKAGETPGAHRNRQGARWQAFLDDVKKNGIQRPIFITVDHGEPPRISEGNHRRDAAVELGLPNVPVEITYFGHAEQEGNVTDRGPTETPYVTDPTSDDFGWPVFKPNDYRINSNADLRREVDYQVNEYDADEASAIENVAGMLGIPYAEAQARYYGRKDLMPPA